LWQRQKRLWRTAAGERSRRAYVVRADTLADMLLFQRTCRCRNAFMQGMKQTHSRFSYRRMLLTCLRLLWCCIRLRKAVKQMLRECLAASQPGSKHAGRRSHGSQVGVKTNCQHSCRLCKGRLRWPRSTSTSCKTPWQPSSECGAHRCARFHVEINTCCMTCLTVQLVLTVPRMSPGDEALPHVITAWRMECICTHHPCIGTHD
jgi:hypothetical protein